MICHGTVVPGTGDDLAVVSDVSIDRPGTVVPLDSLAELRFNVPVVRRGNDYLPGATEEFGFVITQNIRCRAVDFDELEFVVPLDDAEGGLFHQQ